MMAKHTKETVKFNSFSGYYASIPQGYGGFNWNEVDYMNAAFWQNEKPEWCDTGYQNAISGAGEAFAFNNNGYTTTAFFQSADLSETFTLKSMVAASAWDTDQPFYFKTYTDKDGQFKLKATDTVYLSQTVQTINFAKIGKPGDFQNIVQVTIVSGTGKYGNTCSYGPYSYTLGNQIAFDNVKVQWNGKIPKGDGKLVTTGLPAHAHGHGSHVVAAQLSFHDAHGTTPGHVGTPVLSGAQTGFHGELTSLGDFDAGGLTAQFHLPAIEHFGT
ncbi:MAG TPA: hypothetical protein VHY79_19440 [Rhizomicrobium sp.]|nr:hypothetical protein [Rhizomicrobium sp.]